jgi:hypothetical protein
LELSHLSKSESFDNNYAKFMYIGIILMLKILLPGNAEERKILEEALFRSCILPKLHIS